MFRSLCYSPQCLRSPSHLRNKSQQLRRNINSCKCIYHGLPSEETVNGFLQATFGYQPALTWKIADIRSAKAQGLAEVTVILSNPQGKQQRFYVTPDGTHAVLGNHSFWCSPVPAFRKELALKAKGPVTRASGFSGDDRRIQRYAMSPLQRPAASDRKTH